MTIILTAISERDTAIFPRKLAKPEIFLVHAEVFVFDILTNTATFCRIERNSGEVVAS